MSTNFSAIGVVEISFYTNAILILDAMLKVADVQLVACEKQLGGRMVSIIIGGDTSSVQAAIEAVNELGPQVGEKNIKVAVTISNPHFEIKKLIGLIAPSKKIIEIKETVESQEIVKVKSSNIETKAKTKNKSKSKEE